MRQAVACLATALLIGTLSAEELNPSKNPVAAVPAAPFKAFTGQITRNKVRLRLQPSLDAPILRELIHHDMLIVVGETDDFYAVKPPSDIKAYVFRTYVLDNVIEGHHINVRLEPDLDSPIIGQLNTGDRVNGTISPLNSKWLEISPPENTKFYVCKEYIENIGDPSVITTLLKRRDEASALLEEGSVLSQVELQKPFEDMHLDLALGKLNLAANQYQDFPEIALKAKELLTSIQETYFQKKLTYLENKANQAENKKSNPNPVPQLPVQPAVSQDSPDKNKDWAAIENALYQAWAEAHGHASMEEFYLHQRNEASVISGIVEPYIRSVRNKPGDFILISKTSRLPIAYLYSTKVDLNSKVGEETTLIVAPRPDNHFAFKAYYVLSIE